MKEGSKLHIKTDSYIFDLIYLGNDGTETGEAFLISSETKPVYQIISRLHRVLSFPNGGNLVAYDMITGKIGDSETEDNRLAKQFLVERNKIYKFKPKDNVIYFTTLEYVYTSFAENNLIIMEGIQYDMQQEIQ